jgi:ethanolamine phosphate phosphodiesterase
LGDLFDGGREWKTAHGSFKDPEWAKGHRPAQEEKYVKMWNRKYGEDFWLREYARFGNIFFKPWNIVDPRAASNQRGRKLVASLPGNHDLGFGSEVKIPVRDRFSAYFGDTNRVDVIGNHTIVSVDTVSLSAGTSDEVNEHDLKPIYYPVELFLDDVQSTKRKAVEKELRFWRGDVEEVAFKHIVEDLEDADFDNLPTLDPGESGADFPTILLTHVPLYREPGTPCGPLREHWPPTPPPAGETKPVFPDHRNAISVSRGYQYQNVLSPKDSSKLITSVGNVIQVFSGDDHDYCEVVHSGPWGKLREITVKSMSMAMGVPTPAFMMVSLHNPVDSEGKPLSPGGERTIQTHLCLLPNQISTYMRYIGFILLSVTILIIRAFLVPALNLGKFALDDDVSGSVLPTYKDKPHDGTNRPHSTSSGSSTLHYLSSRITRNGSDDSTSNKKSKSPHDRWRWANRRGPKIEIYKDDFYDGGKSRMTWKAASTKSPSTIRVIWVEIWTTVWRVTWLVVLFWFYLALKG